MSTSVIVSWPVVSVCIRLYYWHPLLFQHLCITLTSQCTPTEIIYDGWTSVSEAFAFPQLHCCVQGSSWCFFSGLENVISLMSCGCLSVEMVETFTPFSSVVSRASLKSLTSNRNAAQNLGAACHLAVQPLDSVFGWEDRRVILEISTQHNFCLLWLQGTYCSPLFGPCYFNNRKDKHLLQSCVLTYCFEVLVIV